MQSLHPESRSDRELHQIAYVSPIKREAIHAYARGDRHNWFIPGREYRASAIVEVENQSTGQPVAQFDIEIEFRRAQSQVFLGGAVELAGPRGQPFNHTAKREVVIDLRPGL